MLLSGKGSEKKLQKRSGRIYGYGKKVERNKSEKCRVSSYVRQMEKTPRQSVVMGTKEIGSEIIDPRYDAELG
jgi:hypothetical protein